MHACTWPRLHGGAGACDLPAMCMHAHGHAFTMGQVHLLVLLYSHNALSHSSNWLHMDVCSPTAMMHSHITVTGMLTHNALSHSSSWLHIQSVTITYVVGEMLGQCTSAAIIYNAFSNLY